MTPLRRLALGALLLAASADRAEAWSAVCPTLIGSGVDAEFSSPVEHCPAHGCLPIWVTVKNRSGAARTWTVRCEDHDATYGSGSTNNVIAAEQTLRVENDQTVRAPVLLPLQQTARDTPHYHTLNVRLSGYGVEPSEVSFPTGGPAGLTRTAYVGMSNALATPIWATLETYYKDRSLELNGSPVDLSLLTPDWRGLSGFDCLWLTEADYTGLDAARRMALRHWLDQGGTLFLCTESLAPGLRAGLGLPEDGDEGYPGAGLVKLVPWDGKAVSMDATMKLIKENNDRAHALPDGPTVTDAASWPMAKSVGAIPLNSTFLIVFIGLFALVAGPVNLFWLAGAERRHRLFWTTPLISCAASLLLILVILLQDGFGGHGERTMVTLLFPDQKKAVVVQEQVVRTGVLLGRRFTASEDLLLTPLPMKTGIGRSFEQAGRTYEGDWFTSRSVQAERAEAVVPSRAEVQLVNAEACKRGEPPVLVSSVPVTLREICYRDNVRSGYWYGQNLRTGERVTLQASASGRHGDFDRTGSALLTGYQEKLRDRPGYFRAVADAGPFFDTLPSVRWQRQQAVYLGPVTTP